MVPVRTYETSSYLKSIFICKCFRTARHAAKKRSNTVANVNIVIDFGCICMRNTRNNKKDLDNNSMGQETDTKYRAPALEKGLDILELLSEYADGLSQIEIARLLGRPANQSYRMLATLERRGYLIKSESGERYQLSMQLYILAVRHPPMQRLLNQASPLLRQTAEKISQSVQIVVINHGMIYSPCVADAPGVFGLAVRAHNNYSLYNSAAGRVLCAFASPLACTEIIKYHQLVAGETFLPRADFDRVLDAVRTQGFAQKESISLQGVTNIAFPVFGPNRDAIAAMACSYLPRVGANAEAGLEAAKEALAEAAHSLSMVSSA